MRRLTWLLLLATMMLNAQEPHPLETLLNNTRALLVFAPRENDLRFRKQRAFLQAHAAEMADRNLILIPVLGHWDKSVGNHDLRNDMVPFTSDREQIYMRNRFHIIAEQFTVILVGKDGGEKLRSSRPVDMERLCSLIDSMPMRQKEMSKEQPRS